MTSKDLDPSREQAAEKYTEIVRRYFAREVIAKVVHVEGDDLGEMEAENKN